MFAMQVATGLYTQQHGNGDEPVICVIVIFDGIELLVDIELEVLPPGSDQSQCPGH